ncbi:amidase family protein, partial [Rhizobiaceae sp. 2RAB30]
GGSTGGGAAAIAAGIGAMAQGNDVGGSIRYPAYCCGIAGLRPSRGRVPMYNATQPYRGHCNQIFNVEGLLARDVRDLAGALPIISRGHVDDPWWVGRPERPLEPAQQARIGLIAENPNTPMDPRVSEEIRAVGSALEALGFEVEEVVPPSIAQAMDLWSSMVFGELRFGWDQFVSAADAKAIRANELFLGATREISVQEYLQGTSRILDIRREWARFMSSYPILVAPTSCDLPYKLDFDLESVDETRRQLFAQAYLPTINLLGLPSVALPTSLVEAPDAPN